MAIWLFAAVSITAPLAALIHTNADTKPIIVSPNTDCLKGDRSSEKKTWIQFHFPQRPKGVFFVMWLTHSDRPTEYF